MESLNACDYEMGLDCIRKYLPEKAARTDGGETTTLTSKEMGQLLNGMEEYQASLYVFQFSLISLCADLLSSERMFAALDHPTGSAGQSAQGQRRPAKDEMYESSTSHKGRMV